MDANVKVLKLVKPCGAVASLDSMGLGSARVPLWFRQLHMFVTLGKAPAWLAVGPRFRSGILLGRFSGILLGSCCQSEWAGLT